MLFVAKIREQQGRQYYYVTPSNMYCHILSHQIRKKCEKKKAECKLSRGISNLQIYIFVKMQKEEFQTKSAMKSKNLGSGLKKLVSIRLKD